MPRCSVRSGDIKTNWCQRLSKRRGKYCFSKECKKIIHIGVNINEKAEEIHAKSGLNVKGLKRENNYLTNRILLVSSLALQPDLILI